MNSTRGAITLAGVVALSTLSNAAETGLNAAAKAAGLKYFGSATDNSELSDSAYSAVLKDSNQFGQITPGNTMKWVYTEPSQNSYSYTQGDQIATFAKTNSQLLRCHNLVWYQEAPSWVTSGTWTNATLIAAMQAHITNEVTHYKGQCYAWDVVNEALNDDGTFREWELYNIIGPAYIPLAFEAAAAADPTVKLYYNDYNIETAGAKATAAQNIVKMIKAYGGKIDGIGLESHFIVGETPSAAAQASNMASFTALGVEVAVTELDVRETLPESSAQDQQQAKDYVSTVQACLQTKNCVGVTVWDFDDQYSWVPSTFSGQGAADLYNSALQPKPAYTSILSALNAAATGGSGSGSSPSTTLKTSTVPTSPTPPASSAPSSGTVAQWGQCGGIGYTGSTVCASPYTCHVQNSYYSQCS
ncbi:MAG: hypothetical protein M1820_005820 [Bogoriella megaspora]|nr:MAG: hypothetical protein M1820_005820 [Bogoriella megaspora]